MTDSEVQALIEVRRVGAIRGLCNMRHAVLAVCGWKSIEGFCAEDTKNAWANAGRRREVNVAETTEGEDVFRSR